MKNFEQINIGDCIVYIFNTHDNKTINIRQGGSDIIVLTHSEAIKIFESITTSINT